MARPHVPGPSPARPPAPAACALPLATAELLTIAEPSNSAGYYRPVIQVLNRSAACYAVNTPLRLAHFLAQVGHESSFRPADENGALSARRMRETFGCKGGPACYDAALDDCRPGPGGTRARLRPKLWTAESTYAFNARNLLSYVYALCAGNGDEVSGDGYRYRGRGLLPLAGKSGYQSFTDSHNNRYPGDRRDFAAHPDLLLELPYALEAAFYLWEAFDINLPADQDDLVEVTRRACGHLAGLDERAARLARIKAALGI